MHMLYVNIFVCIHMISIVQLMLFCICRCLEIAKVQTALNLSKEDQVCW